jgi:hypothetical protein
LKNHPVARHDHWFECDLILGKATVPGTTPRKPVTIPVTPLAMREVPVPKTTATWLVRSVLVLII